MAQRQIPIEQGEVGFLMKLDLDNRPYSLRFTFNIRLSVWLLDISDDAGEPLVAGIPIYVKQDLLKYHRHDTRLPQGTLVAVNLVDGVTNPDLDTFGSSVLFLYEEVAA